MLDADLIADFFDGVFGKTTGSIVLTACGRSHIVKDAASLVLSGFFENAEVTANLQTYEMTVVGVAVRLQPEEHPEKSLQPTFIISNQADRYACWLLNEPVLSSQYADYSLLKEVNQTLNEEQTCFFYLPVAGAGGWTLVDADTFPRYTVSELWNSLAAKPLPTWNDAVIRGELTPAILDREVEIAFGANRESKKWRNKTMKLGELLAMVLTRSEVGGKDGKALLQGAVVEQQRSAQAIKHLDLLMLDLDTGEDLDALRGRIQDLGLFAVIYTTYSHLKPISEVKRDVYLKWSGGVEPTADGVSTYLREKKRYQSAVLVGSNLLDTEHTKDGVILRLKHQPMPKFRLVFLLESRFEPGTRTTTHKEGIVEWNERYAGVSVLLGASFDRSCIDPSRLMYAPRRASEDAKFLIEVIAGKPLDLDSVDRVKVRDASKGPANAWEAAAADMGGGKGAQHYETVGLLRFFAKYGDRFELADFMLAHDPDGERGPRSGKPGFHWRCPNDDAHTNAGDPEDRGFFCVNASDGETSIAKCMHDSCSELDRVNFVDLVCQAVGIEKASDLRREFVPELVGEVDEDEEASKEASEPSVATLPAPSAFGNPKEAHIAVDRLAKGDIDGAELVIQRLALSSMTKSQLETVITKLSKVSGIGRRSLQHDLKDASHTGSEPELPTVPTEEAEEAVDEDFERKLKVFNKKYAIAMISGKCKILRLPDHRGELPIIMDSDSFKLLEAPSKALIKDDKGDLKKVSLASKWLEWDDRTTLLNGIVFEPGKTVPNAYNIWDGFPIKPRKGDWSLLRSHVLHNICKGNLEHYQWLMTWVAQIIQQPGEKLGSMVVLRGEKGTGKSKLFDWLREGMGAYALKVSQKNHILGNFNAHQQGLVLMVAEEAFWANDHQAGGVLKDLITSDEMILEMKGLNAFRTSNYMRLAMISNERWVVPAGLDDERRYFVLEVGNDHKKDIPYFIAIDKQMETGGLEAMWYDLTNWTPPDNNWNILRTPPITESLIEQGLESLDIPSRFFLRLVTEGEISQMTGDLEDLVLPPNGGSLPIKLLRAHYEHWLDRAGGYAKQKYGNDALLKSLAQKWLGASKTTIVKRVGHEIGRCYYIKPFSEIQSTLMARHLDLDIAEEEPYEANTRKA